MLISRMLTRFVLAIVVAVVGGSLGCATSFTGDPHVPGGPSGCIAKCNSWRMELVGMVSMGEYSDGCICRIPQQRVGAMDSSSEDGSVAGAAAAGAAVFVAMQEAQRQQQQMHMTMHH